MTYGTEQLKNGQIRGYLTFSSGKRVALSNAERAEYDAKAREYEYTGKLKEQARGNDVIDTIRPGYCDKCGSSQKRWIHQNNKI
jgi:hypothetical protein